MSLNETGLFIKLGGLPQKGDSFEIDGNVDGIGDNANIIEITQLEKKKVFGGEEGFSLSEKYGPKYDIDKVLSWLCFQI